MADWRAEHQRELLDKQRHISQKLAQLREFQALMRKWQPLLERLESWFSGGKQAAMDSRWYSVDSLTRMGNIGVQLQQFLGELEQIGDPKTTGTGTTPATTPTPAVAAGTTKGRTTKGRTTKGRTTQTPEQKRQAEFAEWLVRRAGPLASTAPWDLKWEADPDTFESVKQGEFGVALTNVLLNPFQSIGGFRVWQEMGYMSDDLIKQNHEAMTGLRTGWNGVDAALDDITDALPDYQDLDEFRKLEEELEAVLGDYEKTYDGALGEDGRSASRLRKLAARQGARKARRAVKKAVKKAPANKRGLSWDEMLEKSKESGFQGNLED